MRRALIVTVPPSGVNLMALEARLSSICFTLPGSASTSPASTTVDCSAMLFVAASGSIVLMTWSTDSATDIMLSRSSIWPASTFERSRMSLIKPSRCLPLVVIWPTNRLRVASSNCPSLASLSSSEKPMIELSGVRSSWLMLARKTLLCLFASMSAALLCSSSWMRWRRSSAVTNALISCCIRVVSSPPKSGVKGPARTTRFAEAVNPLTGTERAFRSTPSSRIRFIPSSRAAASAPIAATCARASRPRARS